MNNKLLIILLCALCVLLPLSAMAATVDSGDCGSGVRWTLSSDGVLTISGSGAMADYPHAWSEDYSLVSTAPWHAHAGDVQRVVVSYGVTAIGESAFAGLDSLISVELASTVTKLGQNAFYYCSSLPSISIPVRVAELPDYAFGFCTALSRVFLPESLVKIGAGAFYNCTSMTSFTIPPHVKEIGSSAFSGTMLTSVTVPDSVTKLGSSAFAYCDALTKVVLPDKLQAVDGYTFTYCPVLTSVTLPSGVQTIGRSAFYNCSRLTSIALGSALTQIDQDAFAQSGLKSITLPESLSWIGVQAFDRCRDLTSVKFLGAAPLVIGKDAFKSVEATVEYPGTSPSWVAGMRINYGGTLTWKSYSGSTAAATVIRGTCGAGLTWTLKSGELRISGMGAMDDYEYTTFNWFGTTYSDAPWGKYVDVIHTVIVENGVLSVGDYAFQHCINLSSISLPTSIAKYGKGVFHNCASMKSFSLPYGVRSVPEDMFNGCEALTSVSLPETITTIENDAFAYCQALKKITLPNSLTTLGWGAFASSGLTSVTIPDRVTTFDWCVFRDCNDLAEVRLGKSVQNITNACFLNTFSLHQLTLPASVRTIDSEAFAVSDMYLEYPDDYDFRKALTFEGNVPAIAEDAFKGSDVTIRYPFGHSEWEKLAKSGKTYGGKVTWSPYYQDDTIDKCIVKVDYTPVFYTGKAILPKKVTVTYGGNLLKEGEHYKLSYENNINAGKAKVHIIGLGSFSGTVTETYEILKQHASLTFQSPSMTCKSDAAAFTNPLTAVTDGKITYSSVDEAVAVIDSRTGQITVKGAGTTYIYANAAEGSNYLAESTRFHLTVEEAHIANPLTLADLSFSFYNYSGHFSYPSGYKIPLDRYLNIYPAVEARRHYENAGAWQGSCYGMSVISCLLNTMSDDLELADFKVSKIGTLKPTHQSASHRMSLLEMIETMQVSQRYEGRSAEYRNNYDNIKGLCEEAENCRYTRVPICVSMQYGTGGHAIIAYDIKKISSTLTHILVYDVNYPNEQRYIRVNTDVNGKITGWFYSVNDMHNCGSAYPYSNMSYYRFPIYSAPWNARFNRNAIVNESSLYIDSDNFEVRNQAGALVAFMKDGQFTSYIKGISQFISPDPSYHLKAHLIYVPTEAYRIVNQEDKAMTITMVNRHQSAVITTTAKEVILDVSDARQTNMVYIGGKAGDSYSLSLESALDCASRMKLLEFNGAVTQDAQVQLGTINGELYVANCDEISMWNDGQALGSAVAEQQDIAGFDVTLDYTRCSYTGEKREPAVFVQNGNYALQEHKDFVVIYANASSVGTATAAVYGIGTYGGVVYRDYEIITASATACAAGHAWNQGSIIPDADQAGDARRHQTCMVCGETRQELIPGFRFRVEKNAAGEVVVSLTNTMERYITGAFCVMVYDAQHTQLASGLLDVCLGTDEQAAISLTVSGAAAPASVQGIVIDSHSLAPLCRLWEEQLSR